MGVAQVIAAVIARMNGGGSAMEAFIEQGLRPSAVHRISESRLRALFEARRLPEETESQCTQVAVGVAGAIALSERLGCRAVPCLQAVLEAWSQMRLLHDLRAQAMAVPKATVGLLTALPAITVALGELMGARPLSFLFGSRQGLLCLVLGSCCYALGLFWMRALLKTIEG
ncbi:hypothetical protein [Bifidobacterium scaligerum]|nr:hypothetical protein [Bifidobacterium scaligerum]